MRDQICVMSVWYLPGKNIRQDSPNPTWDPGFLPAGIAPILGGILAEIPPGIMERPGWDPGFLPPGIPPRIMEPSWWDPRWDSVNPMWDPESLPARIRIPPN